MGLVEIINLGAYKLLRDRTIAGSSNLELLEELLIEDVGLLNKWIKGDHLDRE